MKKRTSFLISLVLTIVVALSACQQVPQNVKERSEELESTPDAQVTQSMVDESSPGSGNGSSNEDSTMGDLEYIRAHIEEDASKKYGTITTKFASAGNAKSMPTYTIEHGGNENFDLNGLVRYFFSDKYDLNDKSLFRSIEYDRTKTEPIKDGEDNGIDYRPPDSTFFDIYAFAPNKNDGTLSLYSYSNGSCWGSPKGIDAVGEDYYAYDEKTAQGHYYPEYEDISGVSYKMKSGEEWALSDAVKFIEKFWNEQLSLSDREKYTYKVYRVDVIKLSNNNYGYYFMLKFYDENGNANDCDTFNYWGLEEEKIYAGKMFFDTSNAYTYCIEKDDITRFGKGASFNKKEKIAENEKLLTLGGAMKILEEKLAKNINLDFDTAELCYIKTCEKYPYKDYGGVVAYSEEYCRATCEMQIRPYWCFRKDNNYLNYWNSGVNYYVDAVTGEIHIIGIGF